MNTFKNLKREQHRMYYLKTLPFLIGALELISKRGITYVELIPGSPNMCIVNNFTSVYFAELV